MQNSFFLSCKEYILSVFIAILSAVILPEIYIYEIQSFFINKLSIFPITIFSILLLNFSTMIVIFLLGLIKKEFISFFLVLNGFALGILFTVYQNNPMVLLNLLFPHSIVEIILIIYFCTLAKELSDAYKFRQNKKIIILGKKILYVCIPLWLISGILEVYFNKLN